MALIGISMRMETARLSNGASELRNSLADDWRRFFSQTMPECAIAPILNWGEAVSPFLENFKFDGFILSGGDDWGVFPLRDETESLIWEHALKNDIPVLGVCRGAQVINRLNGGGLAFCEFGHAGARHDLIVSPQKEDWGECGGAHVNSFHNYAIPPELLAPGLTGWACAGDGTIEGFADAENRTVGIMWHPEREEVAREMDKRLFQKMFGKSSR